MYIHTRVILKVDSIEQAVPIVEELISLEKEGVMAYDALLCKEVIVLAPVLLIACDNPRASEITNNLGPGSRMFCRICMVSIHNIFKTIIVKIFSSSRLTEI